MEEHGEAAGEGDGGAVVGSGRGGELSQCPSSEVGVGSPVAEGEVSSLDQEGTEIAVPFLGDGEAGVAVAGLAGSRDEAKVGADLAAATEAGWVSDGEDEGERSNRADAGDLLETACVGETLLDEALDDPVEVGDTGRERGQLLGKGEEGWLEGERHP
jgi:hypothetical protein